MELKEAQKKRVCRICHLSVTKKSPYNKSGHDAFVYDFGKEHAHQDCLDEENNSKKKIEKKETEPITVDSLGKEMKVLEEAKKIFTKDIILLMLDGQTEIRKRFIKTLKELKQRQNDSYNILTEAMKEIKDAKRECCERSDLLISEIKRITGCKDEDIEFFLGMPGQIRKPIINVKLGEEKQKRFDLEDEIKRKDAQINEAIGILSSGSYENIEYIITILNNSLSK